MKLIDYLFYRIYSFYKGAGDSTPILMGILILSLMKCLTLLTIVVFLSIMGLFQLDENFKPYLVILLIIFPLTLWKRYDKFDFILDLIERNKDESLNRKRIRGWLIVSYLILVLFIPISVGYMRHNLGMDI